MQFAGEWITDVSKKKKKSKQILEIMWLWWIKIYKRFFVIMMTITSYKQGQFSA